MSELNKDKIQESERVNELLLASIFGQHKSCELSKLINFNKAATARKLNELCSLGKIKRERIRGIYFYANNDFEFNETKVKRKAYTRQIAETAIKYNETLIKKWV